MASLSRLKHSILPKLCKLFTTNNKRAKTTKQTTKISNLNNFYTNFSIFKDSLRGGGIRITFALCAYLIADLNS